MTKFAPTPEGRAAADRMMQEYGHTNAFMPPRPGFPGRPGGTIGGVKPVVAYNPRDIGTGSPPVDQNNPRFVGLGSMQANSPQLAQMQGMLQGTPIGGNPRQVAQPPQQPTGRGGFFGARRGLPTAGNMQAGTPPGGPLGFPATKMKKGGAVKKKASSKSYKSGGTVSSASKRGDGCAIKGKTKCKIV